MVTKYEYTKIPPDAFEKLAVNAGILVDEFDPGTRKAGKQLGVSSGGIKLSCVPSLVDMGEDMDNCPKEYTILLRETQRHFTTRHNRGKKADCCYLTCFLFSLVR